MVYKVSYNLGAPALCTKHRERGSQQPEIKSSKQMVLNPRAMNMQESLCPVPSPGGSTTGRHTKQFIFRGMTFFVLPTSYLSEKRLQKIEQHAIGVTLRRKGGFVLTFSRPEGSIWTSPLQSAMWPLTTKQLIQQVQTVLKHLRSPGENHGMLRIMLSWAQLLGTGMAFLLLEWLEKEVPHLKCEWLQSIRTKLTGIGAHIKSPQDFVYKLWQHTSNCHLMDSICDCK
jgi:hypothetical protein